MANTDAIDRASDARGDVNDAVKQLQLALSRSTGMQALVLLPLIERAAILARDINQFVVAAEAEVTR